jgi:subtilase family serine protease
MRIVKSLLPVLVIASLLSSLSYAAVPDRISGVLTSGQTVPLRGNVHHKALPKFDQGPVDPAMQLGTITLTTVPTAAQQKAITRLLAQQQDRKSSNYHKWLTPEQYADRFGLSQPDMQQMAAWLKSKGFTMIQQARGRNWISFTGTAAQVQNAFGAEIHHYNVKGELHYANATAPQIPAALSGVVSGLMGLHDFLPKPMNHRPQPNYYSSNLQAQFIAPGDIATIYDINALYTAGFDGTGQKLAVMGQTQIYLSDINDFRAGFGLSTLTCTTQAPPPNDIITACSDPHFSYVLGGTSPIVKPGDLSEADLDLEWAGAVARGAQIVFVNSTNTFTSFYYAIDNNVAPVISLSYGTCEFYANIGQAQGFPQLFEPELMKANTEGITFVNSSGDSGAAECDINGSTGTVTSTGLATQGLGVSYPASSPEVTSVGGTAIPLANFGSQYWNTPATNQADGGTAKSYVPEQAWNDDDEFLQYCQQNAGTFCTQGGTPPQPGWVPITSEATAQQDIGISSTGGGASNCAVQTSDFSACVSGFPQPSWQTVTVAGQATRLSPDVSFLATPNFPGYIFCTELSELQITGTGSSCAGGIANAVDNNFSLIGGTSVSAPVFAGIVTVLNQYMGTAQGNINPSLYQLAATAPGAFNDVNGADNKVACQANSPGAPQPSALWCPSTGVLGFTAGAGYDLATGLGSMDVNNFAVALAAPPDFSASSPTTGLTLFAGQSGTATITVTPINNFTGSVSFACTGLPAGNTCSFNPTSVTPSGAPVTTTATIQTGGSATTATVDITATTGVLSQVSHPAAAIALTLSQAFTLAPTAPSFTVTQGATANPTVTVTGNGGFTGPLTFTCSDPAPESICTPPPNTNASSTPVTVSFQITTTGPTASLRSPSDRGTRIFYAMLLPGLLGIMFTAGSRRRSLRGMRFLGLIMVLGFSTLWLASCGGSSNSTPPNQGTPKGTYTVSVNATSGNVTGTPTTFTIVVQ